MAMEDDLLKQIQNVLNKKSIGFNVLEAQIDVEKQMEYFEYVKKLKKNEVSDDILEQKDILFNPETDIEEKKRMLCELALLEDVKAYRTIEKYLENTDEELKDWAQLAYNESRMILESALLDENQIFISTGLGGKGQKLRSSVHWISHSCLDRV